MSVTIEQLEIKAKEISEARSIQAEKKIEYSRATEVVDTLEAEFMAMLEQSEISSYKSKVGTLTIASRESVKFPQDIEKRLAFAEWAKAQGIYDQIFTVNSQTLNSLYKREKEASELRGELFFELPGIERGSVSQYLTFRKV